jgi:hypothetical protein
VTVTASAPSLPETLAATGVVKIYPDLGFRIVPEISTFDIVVNKTQSITFLTVSDAGRTIEVAPDLRMRLEHWTDDHSRLLWWVPANTTDDGTGRHTLVYDFPAHGMFHLTFASTSARFGFNDTPLEHAYAIVPVTLPKPSPPPSLVDSIRQRLAPGPDELAVVGALAAGAAALAGRRRAR